MSPEVAKGIKKVLIIGSGGLRIGQAGEFDYSGSQAIKALKEEGITTVLINPNIATVQTSEGLADKIYFLPITPTYVEEVIKKEKPDGLLLSFGGQSALNCGVALEEAGTLKKHGIKVLGTPVRSIQETEDRDLFVKKLNEIGVKMPISTAATKTEDALTAAEKIGYPVMMRVAYALGGLGSGICRNEQELAKRCSEAFAVAPQVLVEEWLGGWKEIEYEVVRDKFDNCITVCNMENLDPLGIHTGESIVVAPSQTLTNREYHKLREIATRVIRHLGIIGECNIQYALDPTSEEYRIIEVNARLSRSSALASKATGYPLAFIAAKLALGYSLTEIENRVTKKTMACFEPALDYVVVKMPRWDLKKFKEVDQRIGSEMKSVGEVMSIGRTFEEALQKSLRMIGLGSQGLTMHTLDFPDHDEELQYPTDKRVFCIGEVLKEGWSVEQIHKVTKIDPWFLSKMERIVACRKALENAAENSVETGVAGNDFVESALLKEAKQLGFSDKEIGSIFEKTELEIRELRKKEGILPVIKQIDTLAAEFPAQTNYLYVTYHGSENDITPSKQSVIVLGSGAYCIGSSVEFDWCCVNAIKTAAELGKTTIMINYNPETVSTDYDECDRLYFDELNLERVLDVNDFENPEGVIVSVGGQIPNNLALPLEKAGATVLGTTPTNIDRAENRHTFSKLLDKIGVDQPAWKELTSLADAKQFAQKIGYPVLIRPSYVLSGAAMNVVWDDESLENFLNAASDVNPAHPVVITKFIENSKEIEIDAVAREGEVVLYAISEHIENAGVHSGDATMMLPAQRLYIETIRQVKRVAREVAKELQITGPFNMQFLAYENRIRVIECNLRASRSFPFSSKVFKQNFAELATRVILDAPFNPVDKSSLDLEYVGVKAAQFSFSRLKGVDPLLGVEMASTGEVACLGSETEDAFLKAFLSVGFTIPEKGILLSTGSLKEKAALLESVRHLARMGHTLYATAGTAAFLREHDMLVAELNWPLEKREPNIMTYLLEGKIDLVINIPKNNREEELENDALIRRTAVDHNISLITDTKIASQMVKALAYEREHGLEIKSWQEY